MFRELIEKAKERRTHLTVYTRTPEAEDRDGPLAQYDVDIEYRRLPPAAPAPFVAIYDGDGFAGAIDREAFEQLLASPVVNRVRRQR